MNRLSVITINAGKGFWNYVNTDSGNRAKVFTLRQNRCSH